MCVLSVGKKSSEKNIRQKKKELTTTELNTTFAQYVNLTILVKLSFNIVFIMLLRQLAF